MRKQSNITDRTSYFQFCSSLPVIEVRLTKCRYPDQPENGFGVIAELYGLQLSGISSPGEPKATPALRADSDVVGELGR